MANITGTAGADTLDGTSGDDLIEGLPGNDMIDGGAGDDEIDGGDDYDNIDGGDGSDIIHAGEGDDLVLGSVDSSTVEPGNDLVFGEGGNDIINYYVTRDRADTLLFNGGIGNDSIYFASLYHSEALTIEGGDGNDLVSVSGADSLTINAGDGDDLIDFYYSDQRSAVTLTLGDGADMVVLRPLGLPNAAVEHAVLITDFEEGAPGDRIWLEHFLTQLTNWDKATNPFTTGHFALVQRSADAVLRVDYDGGGNGYEDLIVFANVSAAALNAYNLGITPTGGATPLPLDGSAGADHLFGADGGELLRGLDGDDEIEGGLGNDQVEGGIGDDRLNGGHGDDVVRGGDGNDLINEPYSGNDELYGDAGHDRINIERTYLPGGVTVLLDGGTGNDSLSYNATGTPRDTVTLRGGDGNDSLSAYRIVSATYDAGAGDDVVVINTGANYTVSLGAGGEDLVYFYPGHAPGGTVTISDYDTGAAGDRLEIDNYLDDTLIGWDPRTNPYETGNLQMIQRLGDSVLQIDRDGAAAGAHGFVDLITFSNTIATTFTSRNLGGYSSIRGTEAGERLEGDEGRNGIYGFGGDDELIGFEEDDSLYGGNGDDVMDGGDGEDLLDGGSGADQMSGGGSDDLYLVDHAGDQVIENFDPTQDIGHFNNGIGDEVRTALAAYTLPDEVERLVGTSSAGQTLTGSDGDNVILGGDGNDVISLLGGSNVANGGAGDDRILGGNQSDSLSGGAGADWIEGGDGNDSLAGGPHSTTDTSDDHLDGGAGNDAINGNRGDDVMIGGTGNDILSDPLSGADLMDGGEGDDQFSVTRFSNAPASMVTMLGGIGNDGFTFVLVNTGSVVVDAGDGDDSFLFYSNGNLLTVTLGTGRDAIEFGNFEPQLSGQVVVTDFVTGALGDRVKLEAFLDFWSPNYVSGTNPFVSGHARVVQSGSSALLQFDRDGGGNSFATALVFQNGDAFTFGAANFEGIDTGNSSQSGTAGNDSLNGGFGGSRLLGLGGDDLLKGFAGEDRLDGDDGNDVLRGGTGADALIGGAGIDTADYAGEFGAVSVNLATGAGRFNAAEGDSLAGIENVLGTEYGDILTGSAGANRLGGNGGNDTIFGGAGADQLNGGAGIDTADYRGNFGAVSVNLATGVGRFNYAEGDTLADIENVYGTEYGDILTGSGVFNILFGLGGNDTIMGGAGADALDGGAGMDTLSYAGNYGGVWADLAGGFGRWNYAEGDILTSFENLIGTSFTDLLRGTADNNRITGGEGADQLFGYAGNDVLAGGLGADAMDGEHGDDTADYAAEFGGIFVNLLSGTGHWNAAEGDRLTSLEKVIGTSFGDVFWSDSVTNYFTGGGGNDQFVYNAGFGHDVITDFTGNGAVAGDTVRFAAGLFADFADLLSKSAQVGSDVVITLNASNVLMLQNTQLANLHSTDFIFG